MAKYTKSKTVVAWILSLVFLLLLILSSGCSILVKGLVQATARECMDHGDNATIEGKSFSRHFQDSVLEDLSGIQPVVDKSKK